MQSRTQNDNDQKKATVKKLMFPPPVVLKLTKWVRAGFKNTDTAKHHSFKDLPDYVEERAPDLSKEERQQQAKQLQNINILCRMAEVHLDDLSDENERGKLRKRIDKAVGMIKEITDPISQGLALRMIIELVHQAGWEELTIELLEMVSDSRMKDEIIQDLVERNY